MPTAAFPEPRATWRRTAGTFVDVPTAAFPSHDMKETVWLERHLSGTLDALTLGAGLGCEDPRPSARVT